MKLILDACSILNLLQVDLYSDADEYKLEFDYLNKLKKIDASFEIVEKVLHEVKSNYAVNLTVNEEKKFIYNYILKYLHTTLADVNQEDFSSALNFTKKVVDYPPNKDNGELHSSSYALYLNRYDNNSVFKTYFITDDDGAIDDFKKFFQVNLLGEIITTIDLLLILQINNLITIQEVVNFLHNLKKHYVSDVNNLIFRIQALQKNSPCSKESSFLTHCLNFINKLEFEHINDQIILHPLYTSIKRKDRSIDTLLKTILTSDFKKVAILEEKLKEIKSYYWTMEKI